MHRSDRLKVLAEPIRLRVLTLLCVEELCAGDLQNLLGIAQSTFAGHMAQLRRVGLVDARRSGAQVVYSIATIEDVALAALIDSEPLDEADRFALERVRAARAAESVDLLGADVLPGRSWEALARLLLACLPPLRIADLGVGSGELTRLLAASNPATRVIAVDLDAAALASLGPSVEARVGDLADPPLVPGEVDLVLLSQSLHCVANPEQALKNIYAKLAPNARIAVLDLAPHSHAWVQGRLGHKHPGFADLSGMLAAAGFHSVSCDVVHVDRRAPAFTTLLALGVR